MNPSQTILGMILILALGCEEPPDITQNQNPFPQSGTGSSGAKDRIAAATWTWEGVPAGEEEDVEDQEEAELIFSGVRLDFFYKPVDGMSGRFTYRNGDGRRFRGLWDLDEQNQILIMEFNQDWESPILTRPNTAVFNIEEIAVDRLELRFRELQQARNAILVFSQ